MAVILLVDDDAELRELLTHLLGGSGHDLFQASNGKDALIFCDSHHVDLVLTDLMMPDMEGIELILRLREKHPSLKVIAMSGGGRGPAEVYLRPTRLLGARCTLQKPFSKAELVSAVEEALNAPNDPV